jgi:hypothetical protein
MSIKLSELIAKVAKRDFEYAGEKVNIEIYTQKVSPTYRAKWQEVTADPNRDSRCQLIADMLATWDVLADDGNPEPVTYEFLQLCPDGFLNQLTEAIEGALFPSAENPTNASSSNSGSQPTTIPQES